MGSSNIDKFVGELRIAGINLLANQITSKINEVYGLDLQGLSDEEIMNFPFSSQYLRHLQRLHLPKLRLGAYPSIFHLDSLTHLSINSCYGGNPPSSFYDLTNLEVVNLAGNNITELSPNLGQLNKLKCLALGSNNLTSLTDNIGQLQNLTYLNLYNNTLKSLPQTIGDLKELVVLALQDNKLQKLPHGIMKLTGLKEFKIHNNPIKLTPANYLWLDVLRTNGCIMSPTQTNQGKICYNFSIKP